VVEGSGWDYPSGSETITICGDDDRGLEPALETAYGASYTRTSGRHVDPIRLLIWTLTALLALCVVVLALTAWGKRSSANQTTVSAATYPLDTVFGDQGTNAADPTGPNGTETACTDETLDAQTGSWTCVIWSPDPAGFPISSAPYDGGPCTERRVDESAGRWVCVQS